MFEQVREQVLATDLESFRRSCAKDVNGVCMYVWDEMVDRGDVSEPFKIGPIVNNAFKGIYDFVRKELKRHPVTDAYAVSYYNEVNPNVSFVDVSVVQCYPNDFHIADVEFSDNRKPIKGARGVKQAERGYHGLHIFGEFVGRLVEVAKHRGVEQISLLVAHSDLYPVFTRHGFEVSQTEMAQWAFRKTRTGFPMKRRVS